MATPSSIADIGRAFDIGSSRAGFATNMPTYPTGYGAPYAPKDPYSTSLLSPDDMGQFRSMFDLWGNRIGQSIGSMAEPFGAFSSELKSFRKYLEDYFARQNAPADTVPPGGTAPPPPPPATRGITPPTPAGTLPDLTNPLNTVGRLVVAGGNIATDFPVSGVGPGVDVTTRPEDLFVPGPPGVAGFVDFGDGTGMDENGNLYRHTGTEWVAASEVAGPGGWDTVPPGFEGPVNPEAQIPPGTGGSVTVVGGPGPDTLSEPPPFPAGVPGDMVLPPLPNPQDPWEPIVPDPDLTELDRIASGWVPVDTTVGGVIDDTVMGGGVSPVGGGGDDIVVDTTTGPIDTTGLGRTIVTLGQGLDAAGNVINLVSGIQNEDPTQSIAGLIGLIGNPAVLNALDIPNVVPGTGTVIPPAPTTAGPGEGGVAGGVSLSSAASIASGLIGMGSSLASDASTEEKAFGTAKGAAQVVGGVASIMGAQGVAKSMPYIYAALSIGENAFSGKPADQQAIEAALDVAGAALAGPSAGMSIFAAQVLKSIVAKAFHDVPHRVREALETSNIGRVVSTAISAIEQAETADELHAVATQGNFGENDWIVAIPMTAGADPRETLDLLSGDPTANVQAGVLDQFKEPMNRAVVGMLKRQAGLIRAAESFTAGSPTPGRQYLASDVEYFIRNIERFDGAPYDALNAAQVERVVGQHLMEVFRRQGGGWYGSWLDPNLVYNQQGINEPLRRRGVSEEDIEAARQLFAAKAPGLTEVHYSQDPAQAMAELTGLPARTTRYFVQGAAGPNTTPEAVVEPVVAPDGETGVETEEQRANRLYEASMAGNLTN